MANLLNEWPLSFVNAKLLCSTFVSIQFHYISVNGCFVEKLMYEKKKKKKNHRKALKNILIVTILVRNGMVK